MRFDLLVLLSGVWGVSDEQEEKPVNLSHPVYSQAELHDSKLGLAEDPSQVLPHYPPVGSIDDDIRLAEDHSQSVRAFPPTGKNPKPRRKCRVCLRKGYRKDTRWFCSSCPSRPALCIAGCFGDFHTKEVYW